MGFLSRLLISRSVRRAMHPGRAVKRAVTPRSVKKLKRAMHPVSNARYSMERSVSTQIRSAARSGSKRRTTTAAYRHGSCPVRHRSADAAARCRNP